MNKTILYLGLNDKDTKTQKIDTIEAYKIVENIILSKEITAYTISQAQGLYRHENGDITRENTLMIILLDTPQKSIDKIVDTLKTIFNQECIGVEQSVVNVDFK